MSDKITFDGPAQYGNDIRSADGQPMNMAEVDIIAGAELEFGPKVQSRSNSFQLGG